MLHLPSVFYSLAFRKGTCDTDHLPPSSTHLPLPSLPVRSLPAAAGHHGSHQAAAGS